jgi:predicted transglutaminase-like cysteine proteinase
MQLQFLILILIAWMFTASPAVAFPEYFHSGTTESSNIRPFVKWTGAVRRHGRDAASLTNKPCEGDQSNACRMGEWLEFLDTLRDKEPREQIEAVNKHMNRHRYVLDNVNWGMEDYWAIPLEFFIKDGDCEDYAIAKFYSLRKLGFSNNQLRIVVLHDQNLNVAHAVLAVAQDDEALILDNFFSDPVPSHKIHHYKPIYSINEKGWWRHR